MTTPKRKSYIPDNFKTVRLFDKALVQSTEIIKDFERQGHTASWTSVTNRAINLMHSTMIDKKFTVVSTAEIVERRANDVGNCIAIVLGTLCTRLMWIHELGASSCTIRRLMLSG